MSYLTLIVIASLFCNTMFNIIIGTGRAGAGRRETRTNFPEDPSERKAKRDYVFLGEGEEFSELNSEVEVEEKEDAEAGEFAKFRSA